MVQLEEVPFVFESCGRKLYGVFNLGENKKIILFLHGWGTYRIGPHQIFVHAARHFQKLGYSSLRFDFSGRGESEGDYHSMSLIDMIQDVKAAVTSLESRLDVEEIILVGMCSGGEVAVAAAQFSEKIKKVILWSSPFLARQFLDKQDNSERKHYLYTYWKKLFNRESWMKLLKGQIQWGIIAKVLSKKKAVNLKSESKNEVDYLNDFKGYRGSVLLIYGTKDPIAQVSEKDYSELMKEHKINYQIYWIEGANHNFYSKAWKRDVIERSEIFLTKKSVH